jgi:hypothetical protein
MYSATNNVFFHNNFIDYSKKVYSFNSVNRWDNGYPSGGNYWSDYTGVDVKSGPDQDLPGSDGMGDTPYTIDADNIDRYPLMIPLSSVGDINSDNYVNIKDAVLLGVAFGSKPGDANWDHRCDLNRDGYVNIKDAVILGNHFGQHVITPENPLPQTFTLNLTAWVGSRQSHDDLYNTTRPVPREWLYLPNTTVQIEAIADVYYALFDHWELDGRNIGSDNPCMIVMDENHQLKAFFVPKLPLNVMISPVDSTVRLGESVTFNCTLSGGKEPFWYQWYLDGVAVWGATDPTWTFIADAVGSHSVYLIVSYWPKNFAKSNVASVTVTPEP